VTTLEDLAPFRHIGESLLFAYAATSDAKNPAAAGEILSDAVVIFGETRLENREAIEAHFTALWSPPEAHRHAITNVQIFAGETSDTFVVTANYERDEFRPDPVRTTLGIYTMTVGRVAGQWRILELNINRVWHKP
jgi:3-phenylpropionate/cinnamic acid dioxygenase small subunit